MVKSLEEKKPRVLRDKSAPPPARKKPESVLTNQPDAETFHYHLGAIMRQQAKIDAERKVMKDIRRAASDSGLHLGDLDRAIRIREHEPETVREEIKRWVQYTEWMGIAPPGTQGDLFKNAAPQLDALKAAENEGYRDGIEGNRGPAIEPERYDTASDVGQARLRGWNAGQDVLKNRFLAKQTETVQ